MCVRNCVVICFQNRTFGIWNTTYVDWTCSRTRLWFAFKIVPLVYEIQRSFAWYCLSNSCDLLSKSYLWYMKYNKILKQQEAGNVVICFQNRTFGIWNTTSYNFSLRKSTLWFAFKIVPLVYEIQLIICIWFIISNISSKLELKKCLLFFIETALLQSFFICKCRRSGVRGDDEVRDVLEVLWHKDKVRLLLLVML